MKHKILVIDDDPLDCDTLKSLLEDDGFQVRATLDPEDGIAFVRQNRGNLSLAILDYNMPGNNGAETAERLRAIDHELQVVTYSGETSSTVFDDTISAGSQYFIQKGTEPDKVLSIVRMFCKRFEERTQPIVLEPVTEAHIKLIESTGLIGCSRHLVDVANLIHKFAPQNETVLITGENGTGKEKVARAIHNLSGRRGPFIPVNCGAIPGELLESELFGHEKGAFSGAVRNKVGLVQAANNGTIFLDEIGDLLPQLQVKLLRFLQEKEIRPVGSNETAKVNTRVILATNVNLEMAVPAGRFREDLYYRIKSFRIAVDPLKARREDIKPLVLKFSQNLSKEDVGGKPFLEETVKILMRYDWPGNVRELENEVRRMVVMAQGKMVEAEDIPASILEAIDRAYQYSETFDADYEAFRENQRLRNLQEERKFLMEKAKGASSIRDFARNILKVSNSTLQGRLKALGIEFRPNNKTKPKETIEV